MRLIKVLITLVVCIFLVSCAQRTSPQESNMSQVQAVNASAAASQSAPQAKCSRDEDCGGRNVVGQPNCFQGNVQGDVTTHTCVNPGKAESYCTSKTTTGIIEVCAQNQFCTKGQCLDYK